MPESRPWKTAQTAEEGLRIFRQAEWDLVLLDYRLPGSSGLEALDELRKIDPDVPTIVLTGAGDDQIATDAIRLGAEEFLSRTPSSPYCLQRSGRSWR